MQSTKQEGKQQKQPETVVIPDDRVTQAQLTLN